MQKSLREEGLCLFCSIRFLTESQMPHGDERTDGYWKEYGLKSFAARINQAVGAMCGAVP